MYRVEEERKCGDKIISYLIKDLETNTKIHLRADDLEKFLLLKNFEPIAFENATCKNGILLAKGAEFTTVFLFEEEDRIKRAHAYFEEMRINTIIVVCAEESNRGETPSQFLLKLNEDYGRVEIKKDTPYFNKVVYKNLKFSGVYQGECLSIDKDYGDREIFTGWRMETVPTVTSIKARLEELNPQEDLPKEYDMSDRFFVNEEDSVFWMYYNPDSISNGQFVENTVSYENILEVSAMTNDPETFFCQIERRAKQCLTDAGSKEFASSKDVFRSGDHSFSNTTESTMKKLIAVAKMHELRRAKKSTDCKPLKNLFKRKAEDFEDYVLLSRPDRIVMPEWVKKWIARSPYTENEIEYMVHIKKDINTMLIIGKENKIIYSFLLPSV